MASHLGKEQTLAIFSPPYTFYVPPIAVAFCFGATPMFNNLITYHLHRAEPLPPNNAQAYQYITAGNGVFLRAENRFFEVLQPIAPCQIRGLPALSPTLTLKVPKMPASLLTQLLANAQQKTKESQLHEAQYLFYHQDNHIRLVKPPQRTTIATVISPHESSSDILLDMHSHGTMSAFWSNTDNTDEQGFRAYGVIGNLHREPEICLRIGVYGYWFPIPLTTLFQPVIGIQDAYFSADKKLATKGFLPKIAK